MAPIIGHADADCFYVSAERVRLPHLRRTAVGVLGNQGACVIAKSLEMKAAGVKTGMPIWEAQPLCPQAVYVKRDFRWYEVLSRRMLELLRLVSPAVEYYSIDEFFFDASGVLTDLRGLQARLLRQVGVPVTIGVSRSKILAKLVSETHKPFGCAVFLDAGEIEGLLARLDVDEIPGIGRRRALKLNELGIRTCLEFARADRRLIRQLLTKTVEDLWWELRGEPVLPILTTRPPHKMVGRGGSIGKATADPKRLNAWIVRTAERLVEALDHYQVVAERLNLWLELKDRGVVCGQGQLPQATASIGLVLPVAQRLFREIWPAGSPVSGMQLIAESLRFRDVVQGYLFDQADPRAERVAAVKRLINNKLGRFTIRSATTLFLPDVYADPANDWDICDVAGKICF